MSLSKEGVLNALKSNPPMKWGGIFTPAVLAELSEDGHEAILNHLPQCGAIAGREPGNLRVLSMGFNVHIGGTDRRVPFPIDFCVRCNGAEAGINLLIRPKPEKFDPAMLKGHTVGSGTGFFSLLQHLKDRGLDPIGDFELVMLKIYRPASPGGYQWGTAGGVFEIDDTAESVSLRETKEEFKGFRYLAWTSLAPRQVYQSGNIFELQSIGAVLGFMPDETAEVQRSEGIEEWMNVSLADALPFFNKIDQTPWQTPGFMGYDAKIAHGLCLLRELLLD